MSTPETSAHEYVDLNDEATESPAKEHEAESREVEDGEPYVGMEFDSEDDARKFYKEYATRAGFVVRILDLNKSRGSLVYFRLGCNKQGYPCSRKGPDGLHDSKKMNRKPSFRVGCNAVINFNKNKSLGKWVVTKFVKEHCHPLGASADGLKPRPVVLALGNVPSLAVYSTSTLRAWHLSSSQLDKDKKIEELRSELDHLDQICNAHREKLRRIANSVEQHNDEFSFKIRAIAENIRKNESETERWR